MNFPHPLLFRLILIQCLLGSFLAVAQPTVCRSVKELEKQISKEESQRLIELKSVSKGIRYELRYASTDNFVGRNMYPTKTRTTFLRKDPAEALRRVQATLQEKGLSLKIWDAYRPYSVTVAFWELIGDERYVANPAKGSGHNRGIAVDLTIVRSDNGQELDMGTGFDHFSDTAHHSFKNLPSTVLQNRTLLRSLMEKVGFKSYEEEWWHYSWPDPSKYEILDIPFSKLKKTTH